MARYIISTIETGVATNGNPWMRFYLLDSLGTQKAMLWNYTSLPNSTLEGLKPGKVVDVTGDLGSFNDESQLKIKTISVSENQNVVDLIPTTQFDHVKLQEEFIALVEEIENENIKALVKGCLFTEKEYNLFVSKPAAKYYHHAHHGGLLEHSVGVCRASLSIANHYVDVDKSLLIGGSLLHDMGKMFEQGDYTTGMEYTDDGKFLGHIMLGVNHLDKVAMSLNLQDTVERMLLEHIITSHHGSSDKGSPIPPQFIEAQIVHQCDYLDAYAKVYHDTVQSTEELGWTSPITKFINNGRPVYIHRNSEQGTPYYNLRKGE